MDPRFRFIVIFNMKKRFDIDFTLLTVWSSEFIQRGDLSISTSINILGYFLTGNTKDEAGVI